MPEPLVPSLKGNMDHLNNDFKDCADFICRKFTLGSCRAVLMAIDGLIGKQHVSISILNPLLSEEIPPCSGEETVDWVNQHVLGAVDQLEIRTFDDVIDKLMAGFAVVLVDGSARAIGFGVQGFNIRSLSEPENETMQHGAKDGFVESSQINMMLIRRRMHTTDMKFVRCTVGSESRTPVLIAYLQSAADPVLVEKVKQDLEKCSLKNLFASEYLTPFLARNGVFNKVGYTERPDAACGKISEGRIVILVDGCASVVIVPQLFIENFQTPDDYANRPLYASFNRLSKMTAFLISVFLPGIYVAISGFHPELLPETLLTKIASSGSGTPFSIFVESILSFFLYELMREAGLRAPKSLSHAVSIVGALVIGDMAVSSGLMSETTLIITAITAIAGYVVPKIYQAATLLRLVFILIGGTLGLWGITLGGLIMLFNVCSEITYGIPITSPVAPFSLRRMRDVFLRVSWRRLSKQSAPVQSMPGAMEEGRYD